MSFATSHVHDWRHEPAHLAPSGRLYGPYRVCPCGTGHLLDLNPPTDHPDSAPADLSDVEEAIVAALDEQFADIEAHKEK